MTDSKAQMPPQSQLARWYVLVPCLLLLLALLPLVACGPGEESEETITAQADEPMGAEAAPDMTEPGAAPTEEAGEALAVAPGQTPPGPGAAAPPPSSEESGVEAAEEPPVEIASEPSVAPKPEGEKVEPPVPPSPEIEPAEPPVPPNLEIEKAEPAVPPSPEVEKAEPTPRPSAVDQGAGKQVFLSQNCNTCHAVSTAGIEAKVKSGRTAGSDLAGVRERRDRGSIEAILKQEEPVNGKKHLKRFSGSQDDFNALVDWLLLQGK